jgi:hypothetical protein
VPEISSDPGCWRVASTAVSGSYPASASKSPAQVPAARRGAPALNGPISSSTRVKPWRSTWLSTRASWRRSAGEKIPEAPPAAAALHNPLRALPQDKIVVTHDVRFAEALAKRAVFFEKGTVAGEGAVPDVVHRFGWSAPPAARP